MELETFYAFVNSPQLLPFLKETWTIPAGLCFLFFYGMSRFNTPFYTIELPVDEGINIRLITQTAPKLTTMRSRYRVYVVLYAILLQLTFITLVFFYPTINDALSAGKITAPNLTGPLQHRAFIALFLLTGVLTSFPGLNKLNDWLLKELHKRALIPSESQHLARRLYQSEFNPTQAVFTNVRDRSLDAGHRQGCRWQVKG